MIRIVLNGCAIFLIHQKHYVQFYRLFFQYRLFLLLTLLTPIKITNTITLPSFDEEESIMTTGITRYIGRRCVTPFVILLLCVCYTNYDTTRFTLLW